MSVFIPPYPIPSGELRHRRQEAAALIAGMFLLFIIRAFIEFQDLIKDGIDLRLVRSVMIPWFEGRSVYGVLPSSDHLPATYAILWPLLGWGELSVIKVFWLGMCLGFLSWLTVSLLRVSRARTVYDRLLIGLTPWAAASTMMTIGVGNYATSLRIDFVASALFLFSLSKPNASAPFFWIMAFRRPVAAGLTVVWYMLVTLVALYFQSQPCWELLHTWLTHENSLGSGISQNVNWGYAHLFHLTRIVDHQEWNLPISVGLLVLAGIAVYRYRDRDAWLLVGCIGIFARLWTYHANLDDQIVLIPLVVLFRILSDPPTASGHRRRAKVLFFCMLAGLLAPLRF